ncbi:hypothetical protein ACLOJK_000508 [Asimina triloba]
MDGFTISFVKLDHQLSFPLHGVDATVCHPRLIAPGTPYLFFSFAPALVRLDLQQDLTLVIRALPSPSGPDPCWLACLQKSVDSRRFLHRRRHRPAGGLLTRPVRVRRAVYQHPSLVRPAACNRRRLGSLRVYCQRPDLSDPEAGRLHRPRRFIVVGSPDQLHQPLSDSN